MGNFSTVKIFIVVAIISIVLFIFLAGSNPFSFGEAYFRPRYNPSPAIIVQPSVIVLPGNVQPTEVNIDR